MSNQYPAKFKQADLARREITLIHVARQKLAMDDDTYRAMLFAQAGVKSSTELNATGRKKVLDHLKASGFKVVAKRAGTAARPAPAKDKVAQVRKIRALLIYLDNKPDAYADGMSKHMFKVDRFEWCTGAQLGKIIAALEYSKKRMECAAAPGAAMECSVFNQQQQPEAALLRGKTPAVSTEPGATEVAHSTTTHAIKGK